MQRRVVAASTSPGESARYWLLIHAAEKHCIEWDDGERLLVLSSAVCDGRQEPQSFSFVPRGSADAKPVTVFVSPNDPIELLTEYEPNAVLPPSHWFG